MGGKQSHCLQKSCPRKLNKKLRQLAHTHTHSHPRTVANSHALSLAPIANEILKIFQHAAAAADEPQKQLITCIKAR